MIAEIESPFVYKIVDGAHAQWWHYVAALKHDGHEFGIQASVFRFGKVTMFHGALALALNHGELSENGYAQMIATRSDGMFFIDRWIEGKHHVHFQRRDVMVDLEFTPSKYERYESKDSHWGCPRMGVSGTMKTRGGSLGVSGTGCFDREIFHGKKLLPGETGWEWTVAWLNDGSTVIDYHYKGEQPREPMHYGPRMKVLTFDRIGPKQEWKRGEHLAFSYTEELCRVTGITEAGEPVFGRGYREIVGYDGAINI